MSLRVVHEVRVGVERVEDVAEDEPVDDVQQDEGRGEEHPGHAVLQKYLMLNIKNICIAKNSVYSSIFIS